MGRYGDDDGFKGRRRYYGYCIVLLIIIMLSSLQTPINSYNRNNPFILCSHPITPPPQ